MPVESYVRAARVAAALALVAASIAHPCTSRAAASPSPLADTAWNTFRADVTIQQVVIGADGAPIKKFQRPPSFSVHMERRRLAAGWRTVISLANIDRPLVTVGGSPRALDNPFLPTRMEYDEDGTMPRYYNAQGARVSAPTTIDRRLIAPPPPPAGTPDPFANRVLPSLPAPIRPDWVESIVSTPAGRDARRQAMERQYGTVRGRVNGLDQYMCTSGDETYEVLANPDAAVPVEMNVARNGTLVSRTVLTHQPQADGTLIRKLLHAENLVWAAQNARYVADVSVANVTFTTENVQ